MIMSNNEKDEFIKKRFSEDKLIVSKEQVSVQIKNDIDTSNIRIRKHTYLERYLMVLLIVLLMISIFCNIYLYKSRHTGIANSGLEGQDEYTSKNIFSDITPVIENIATNRVPDMVVLDEPYQFSETEVPDLDEEGENLPATEVEDNLSTKEVDEEAIKNELTEYAITIGRYGSDASELEKNTILLLIANDFFNNKVSTNKGLEISSNGKYSMTGKNVHKFVEELTGMRVNDHLNSFTNYMKYNNNSKFYSAGSDSTKLKEEKYEITSIKVTERDAAGEYKAIGNINKKSQVEIQEKSNTRIEDIEANYSFEAVLKENKNYIYVQYQIKDFVTELRPGDEDNITRLVGIAEQEGADNKKK